MNHKFGGHSMTYHVCHSLSQLFLQLFQVDGRERYAIKILYLDKPQILRKVCLWMRGNQMYTKMTFGAYPALVLK